MKLNEEQLLDGILNSTINYTILQKQLESLIETYSTVLDFLKWRNKRIISDKQESLKKLFEEFINNYETK